MAPARAPTRRTPASAPRHPRLAALIGESPKFVRELERIPLLAACDAGY